MLFDTNYPAILAIYREDCQYVKLKSQEQKLWGGRFEEATSPFVERFLSVSFDNASINMILTGLLRTQKMLEKVGTLG